MSGRFIEVKDLRVTFPIPSRKDSPGIQAVRGVSYGLERGEILGVVGESGSGKSVSTSAIPGLLPPHAIVTGSVRYEGAELLGLPVRELYAYRGRKIGMIFQEPGRSYDPLQNIASVFHETFRNSEPGIGKAESARRAVKLLSEVGLPDPASRLGNFPHQFSGGQLQRIGTALALAQGCDLLIADEPTTALDVTIQAQIVALLRKIREERDIAIVFISHNIDLVAGISDRLMVMYGGLVMEEGPTLTVLRSPAHPYTRALLAAAPQFESHYSRTRLLSIPGRVPDPADPGSGCPFAPRCPHAAAACSVAIPKLRARGPVSWRCILDPEAVQ